MKTTHFYIFLCLCLFILCAAFGCSSDTEEEDSIIETSDDTGTPLDENGDVPNDGTYTFETGLTFEWRLDALSDSFTTPADVIDIDAFDASPALVSNLQAQGKKVVAYLSVGSVENFRDDADQFPQSTIGAIYEGFEDENWLDIRQIDLIAPVLRTRLDMIQAKGFDAIEPDNINGYQNVTGFALNENDAIAFSRWLIVEAHARGLSIGQKNAEEIIPQMVDEFDWILSEDAFVEGFQDTLEPYITAGKAVFFTEYTDRISTTDFQNDVCAYATVKGYSAVLKDRDLTNTTIYCN